MKITADQVLDELNNLNNWEVNNNTIEKEFILANFKKAIVFTNQVAEASEKADHHPDILVHNWNRVTIVLTTHSEGGLTQKDFALAKEIDQI